MTNSATEPCTVASATKGLIFAALALPLGIASAPAFAGANIQMLPPVTEATKFSPTPTPCPSGGAPNILTWDGTNPISCTTGVVVSGGNVQVGVNGTGTSRQLSLGSWADVSASATGWGLFGGNMYLQEGTSNFSYSNTHGSIGAVGFATNFPAWNQASVITSGTASSTANNTFTPSAIATFEYVDPQGSIVGSRVGIGSSSPNSSLDLSQKTDAVSMPSGSTGQEPGSPVKGMTRYNTDTDKLEYWNGGSWVTVSPQIEIGSWTGNVNDGGYYGSTHCMGMSFTPGYSLNQIRAVGTIYYPANGMWDWSAWSLFFVFNQSAGQPDNGQGTVCIDSGGNWHGVIHSEYVSWTVFVEP